MAENTVRPPEAPKPSGSSSLSTNRLKNRLILGWSRLPANDDPIHEAGLIHNEHVTLKGFGEGQFDIADTFDSNRSMVGIGMGSSLWSENTFTKKLNYSSTFASSQIGKKARTFQTALTGDSVASVGSVASLRGANFGGSIATHHPPTGSQFSLLPQANSKSTKKTPNKRKQKVQDPSRMPHLSVSQLYNASGWGDVAASMAIGDTEFCYLESDKSDTYKFSLQNNYPVGRIAKNDFVTMSKHGVMRSSIITGESEMVSHEDMLVEHEIYHKLVQIRVFKQFRLWKTFLVWRTTTKHDKYERTVETLRKNLLLVDPFYRSLIFHTIHHCASIQELTVMPLEAVTVYDQKSFAKHQKGAIATYKTQRDVIMDKLIQLLCRLGQAHVHEAMGAAPSVVSMTRYNNLKAGQSSTSVAITAHVVNAGAAVGMLEQMSLHSTKKHSSVAHPHTHRSAVHPSVATTSPAVVLSSATNSYPNSTTTTTSTNNAETDKLTVSYTAKAAIRTNCRRLANLFRLVDFMVRDALFNSVQLGFSRLQCVVEGVTVQERQIRRLRLRALGAAGTTTTNTNVSTTNAHTATTTLTPEEITLLQDAPPVRERAIFRLVVDLTAATEDDESYTALVIENNRVGFASSHASTLDAHLQRVLQSRYTLVFDVSLQNVLRTFTDAAVGTMRAAAFKEGLLSLEVCTQLLFPIINEITSFPLEDRFVYGDTAVHAMLHSCNDVVSIDYARATHCMQQYAHLCDTYLLHTRILETAETTQLSSMPPETMAEILELFKTSAAQCSEVSDVHDIGVFRLEFASLKAKINDLISQCRALFYRLVPELYVLNGDILYNELSHLIAVLDSHYTTLDAFVKVVEVYHKTSRDNDKWSEKFAYIMAIRDILSNETAITKSDAIVRQNLTLVTVWQRYTTVMSDFEDSVVEKSKLFQVQLKQRTRALVGPLDAARHYLHATMVHDHNSDADNIIAQLSDYQNEVEVVLRKGVELEHYQTVLKYSVYHHAHMADLNTDLQAMHVLWSLVKLIKELEISFMSVNFLDAASSEVEKQLRYVKHTIEHKLRAESVNAVQIWLCEALSNLQVIAPIVKKLQAPTQKASHIARIHTLLNRNIYSEEDVSVGELVDVVHILQHAAALDVIYEESLFEYNLEASMKTIHKKLHAYEYALTHEKDNNTLIYASNCSEIDVFLTDARLSMQACMQSTYAAPHREVFRTAEEALQRWLTSHAHFAAVQAGYLRIRILFTCARTARFLSSSVKHFKILDENWRTVIKHAKTELKIASVYDDAALCECLELALLAIENVDRDLRVHIRDQCVKYPKLYLLDADYLVHVFATLEPSQVFQKCALMFPALTDVLFLPDDPHTCSGAASRGEGVLFRKPCSARSSLVDWLRAVENGANDRLESEIKDYMCGTRHLLEDLKFSKGLEQSRLVCVQALFWAELLKHINDTHAMLHHALHAQLHEIIDQIALYSGLTVNHAAHMDAYHRKCLENLVIVLLSQRDLIYFILDAAEHDNNSVMFALECSVKKLWDSETSTLYVKQGQHKRVYGMKYSGFCERLVITPLTDKFFLSVTNVVESGGMACVVGERGSGKLHTTSALAQECGLECMVFDMRNVKTVETFVRIVRAHVGSGVWANYTNLNSLSQELLSVSLTVFSAVHAALANKEQCVYLQDQKIDFVDRSVGRPRFCLHFHNITHPGVGNGSSSANIFPPSVRRQFRILHYTPPARKAIFSVLLSANNFTNVSITATKLDALCEYVLCQQLCPESILLKLLVKTIPLAKLNYIHPTAPPIQQLGLYTKQLISHIPWALQDSVSVDHLRYICNLFLEVIYTPEKDFVEFKRLASVPDCAALLHELLKTGKTMSVLVCGAPCGGKSTLIREVASNAASEYNADLSRALSLSLPKYHTPAAAKQQGRNMALHPKMCNVFSMAHYLPPGRESVEYMPGVAPALHSALLRAAEVALGSVVTSIDVSGDTQLLHMDTQSSLQLSYLLPQAEYLAYYYTRPVRFIWECVELHHIDPSVLVRVPSVCIKNQIFDAEDVIAYQLKRIASKYCHQLHEALTQLTTKIIRPCLQQRPRDSLLSECALTENVYKMVDNLLTAGQLLVVAASLKQWEHTVHRVVVLACVWSVAVCSGTSRAAFESWFCEYFDAEMRTNEHLLYPPFDLSGTSLYDYALHCSDNKEVYLEWTVFHPPTMMKLLGQQSSSENTSEERMRRSYQDIYYSTLHHSTTNLVIPTPTAAAYMLLQSAIMKSGGGVLVSGAAGSGKSTLLRQLMLLSKAISTAKLSHECASRWVCHVPDCGPLQLQTHIESTKAAVLPLLMERKLPERGAVIIDDVSMHLHCDNHTTSAEYLRTCFDTQEMYFAARQLYRPMARLYTLLGTNNISGEMNKRFLRHLMVLCCDENELNNVFARKLQHQCAIMTDDVAHDLSMVTLTMTRMYTEVLHKCQYSSETAALYGISNLSAMDKLFLLHNTQLSYSSITDCLLSKICTGLVSMGGSYSSNDVVRVYDRTLSDYFVRNAAFSKLYETLSDTCSATLPFMYPSFSSFMDKERTTRRYATDALVSSLYNNEPPTYPLSYKLNASGYYDSKSGIYAGLSCAESIRDMLYKKYTRSVVPPGVCGDTLSYWTEVMAVCAEMSTVRMCGDVSITLLHNSTPVVHSKVVSVAALYLYGKYQFVHLDPSVYTTYAPLTEHSSVLPPVNDVRTNTSSNDVATIASISGEVDNHNSNTSNTNTITANIIPTDTTTISFQEALTNLFLEAFLLDNIALRSIKLHTQQHTPLPQDTLLSPVELDALSHTLHPTQREIVRKMVFRYASVDVKTAFLDESVPPEKSDRRMCVWHLALSSVLCNTTNSWQLLLDTMQLRSECILRVLRCIGAHLDPSVHKPMREIVCEYLSRQKYVLSLAESSVAVVDSALRHMHAAHYPAVGVLSCYESYQSGDSELVRMVGEDCALHILSLVDKLTTECTERLISAHKSSIATTIQSVAYRNDTVQSVLSVYQQAQQPGWKSRFLLYVRHYAASCVSDVSLLDAITVLSEPQSPMNSSHKSYQEDGSIDETPMYDRAVLGDVVRSVLISRYSSVVCDNTVHNVCSTVSSAVSGMGLSSVCTVELPVSVIVLATAATLQYYSFNSKVVTSGTDTNTNTDVEVVVPTDTTYPVQYTAYTANNPCTIPTPGSPTASITSTIPSNYITTYLSLAGALPAVSVVRDLLASLCMQLVTGHTVTCTDDSYVALLLLLELAPCVCSLARSTHHISGTFAPVSVNASTSSSGGSGGYSSVINNTNMSLSRMQAKSALPTGTTDAPIVVFANSPLIAELVLIYVCLQQKPQQSTIVNALCEYSAVLHSLHTLSTVDNELSALAVLVPTYAAQWREVTTKATKSCNTLSALFQAIATTATCAHMVIIAVWNEFSINLRHLAANVPERRMVRHNSAAVHTLDHTTPEFVVSQAIQLLIAWLEKYLPDSEYYQVLIAVVLNLYLHTSTPVGQTNAHRVLLSLKPVLHDKIGIVPLGEMDELSDSESEKSSLSGDDLLHNEKNADNDSDVDANENFKLTDMTVVTLKQSLLAISTAISATTSATSLHTTANPSTTSTTTNTTATTQPVRRKSLTNSTQRKSITGVVGGVVVAETNASIVSDIRKNIEEWVLWVLDSHDTTLPFKGTYTPNWLDRIAVCLCIKPSVLLPTLLAAVVSVGLDTVVHAGAELTRAVAVSAVLPTTLPVHQEDSTQLVVFTHGVGAKDVISELEHGGSVATLTDFTHAYKTPDNKIHRAVNRLATQVQNTADAPLTRQSMISAQSQQDAAMRAALAVQEKDRNVHYFLSESARRVFACTPAQLRRLLQCSKAAVSRVVDPARDAQTARQFLHFVVLPTLTRQLSLRVRGYDAARADISVSGDHSILEVSQHSVVQRAGVVRTPMVVPYPTTQAYVQYLQYCYSIAADLPLNCPAQVNAIVLRVRWLLVLFHVSVQCKLSGQEEYASIGVDTLIQALINVDTLFTRAYYNVPKEEFLAPEKSVSQRSSFVSTNPSRRNSNVHATTGVPHVSLVGHSAVVVVPERPETRRSDVLKFSAIAWSLDMLVIEVADCLYGPLTPCAATRDTIRAIYNAYFTVGSLNPTAEYLIKGKVVLPQDLTRAPAERFFREMRQLAEEECGTVELSDSTLAEANSIALMNVNSSVDRLVDVWNNRGDGLSSKSLPTINTANTVNAADTTSDAVSTPAEVLETLYRPESLHRVRRILTKLLDHLPAVLDVESTDIAVRMKDHKKNLGRPVALGTVAHHAHAPQIPINPSEASQRRRRAEKIVTTFESREFDPLWAYLLSETTHYNDNVRAIRAEINEILRCEFSLVQFLIQRGVSLSSDMGVLERLHAVLQDVHDGCVPSHLYTAHTTSTVRIDDLCRELADQRAQLHDWLSYGYPGKIRMHLLRNPSGLMYALKETFCMRTDNTLDKVYIDFRVQEVTNMYLPDLLTISKTNFGCSVMLSDMYLHNALYSEKSSLLEFLPEPSASSHGKRLAVVVTVTKDPHPHNPEEYMCPLYVHSLLPTTHDILALQSCTTSNGATQVRKQILLAHIPMETTEDVEDCKMYGVAVHSGNDLTLPV